jgi:lysophospholipase L1-like esterase
VGEPNWFPKPATAAVTAAVLGAVAAGIAAGAVVGHGARSAEDQATPQRARVLAGRGGAAQAPASAGAPAAAGHEVVTWAAAPADLGPLAGFGVPAASAALPASVGAYRTVRDIVHTSVGGWSARIRLTNEFGTGPVTFDDVEVAPGASGQALPLGPERRLTFGGQRAVTIPPGAEVLSDPLPGYLDPGSTLAVSIHVVRGPGRVTGHPDSLEANAQSRPGEDAASASASGNAAAADWSLEGNWLFLDGILVTVPRQVGTVVALGDSITDGLNSTPGDNERWPDDLARRLLALPQGQEMAVANEGLASNRVATTGLALHGGRAGLSAQARFGTDVLAQPGVTTVILFEGINDIGDGLATARQLIAADTQLIDAAHAAGLRILGGTLTPFGGAGYYSLAREEIRQQLNAWIRTSGAFDGVVDFDRAVRDPADPSRLAPGYDSGDHIHLNDDGYQAMADAVDLSLLE